MVYDPAKRKERYEKNKEKNKEQQKEYYEKNKEKRKEYNETNKEILQEKAKEYYEKNKEQINDKKKEYNERNKVKNNERDAKYREDRRKHAYDSITSGSIIDQHKWDLWCNLIRGSYTKYPYSDDFTNGNMFEMMVQGCFYCGDIATSIDRIDSTLDHTPGNCVGSCNGCNYSKGAADPSTFIRKAYYRAREKYYDDDADIWYVYKQKPRLDNYKIRAKKQSVPFDLTKEDWERLVKGDCEYCKRSPITWFGVDRVIPTKGYVLTNVVSCCYDCNIDKLDNDIDTMIARNERIITHVVSGKLCIDDRVKVILHTDRSS